MFIKQWFSYKKQKNILLGQYVDINILFDSRNIYFHGHLTQGDIEHYGIYIVNHHADLQIITFLKGKEKDDGNIVI